jgi:hypothetical protein
MEKEKVPQKLRQRLRRKSGMDGHKLWQDYWKELRLALTCHPKQNFPPEEKHFLEKLIKFKYARELNSARMGDATYTKFKNRSIWSAIEYDYNIKFYQK